MNTPANAAEASTDPVLEASTNFVLSDADRINALVLDDNSFDRRRLMRECQQAGLDIVFKEVSSLFELKSALDSNVFDLIFVDFRLTDGDGIAALKRIYNHPRHIACATIMIAGEAETHVAVEAIRSGCSDYLVKSKIDANSIRRAVTNVIQKSSMQREIASANGMNAAMTSMIEGFASECLNDMKPILSRMLRKIRSDRGQTTRDLNDTACEVETACNELWDFLQRIEDYARKLEQNGAGAAKVEKMVSMPEG